MELKIRKIKEEETEYIEIGCHKRDDRINEIVRLVKMHHGSVEAYQEDTQYQIPLSEIYYIEAVDEKTFIYLEKECYESRKRLYEFEELLANRKFARI
jgi:DNA-binding LytR/AlgR family response regulator